MDNNYNQRDLEEINYYENKITKTKKNKKIAFTIMTIIVIAIVIIVSNYESSYYEKNHSDSIGWAILIFGPIFVMAVALLYALINGAFTATQDKYRKCINNIKYRYYPDVVKSELSNCYLQLKKQNTKLLIIGLLFVIISIVISLLLPKDNNILIASIDFIIFVLFLIGYSTIKSKKNKIKYRIEQLYRN